MKKLILFFSLVSLLANAEDVPTPNWVTATTSKQTTNYTSEDYETPKNQVANLPPLNLGKESNRLEMAKGIVSPLSADEIKRLRGLFDETREAKYEPTIKTIPRITTQSVDLSPGASLPILRTMPQETSTIVFIDSAGMPWNIVAIPRVSNPNAFDVEWLKDSSSVIISVKNQFQQGNLTVFLEGLISPVVVKLTTSDLLSKSKKERIVDYRLDLRLPYRGPNSRGETISDSKISIYDDVLQSILDGVPPSESKKISFTGSDASVTKNIKIWQVNSKLYVRSNINIQNAYDKILSSSDGTKVFELPVTPYLTLSSPDKKIILKLNI